MLVPQSLLEMPNACTDGRGNGSWTCAAVYEWTGNRWLAHTSAWLIGRPLAILGIAVVAILVRWITHRAIDRLVRRAEAGVLPGKVLPGRSRERRAEQDKPVRVTTQGAGRRVQRAQGLGSLLKSVITGLVFGVAAVMILAECSVNIVPIITSAGVVGIAIAFGAQSLVKDFMSGVAMMIEDQYGVGDVVDLGEASGTVEAVGLRITRVRDVNGTVWYVRNGEVVRVGNMSQNWARTVLDVSVRDTEDISHVQEVLEDVAEGLWHDERLGKQILEQPEVWGVQSLYPGAVVIRVALKTAPLEQWEIAREMRKRIKNRFDREGIEMPLPQRVVTDPTANAT
ncbi:MAG TPA: mechanosensitive ion channel family protein [Marmoricola sp.]|nr:mechanosensitive ion channel family protein [Marmoricola sp.]